MTESESDVRLPPGLIDAVLHLVSTGPVHLGGYSLAEMVAVDAVVDFLDRMPSEEEVAEAVRSLAARQLLVERNASRSVATWASPWYSSSARGPSSMLASLAPSRGRRGGPCCYRSLRGWVLRC
jgi:hypothetical protein